MVGGADTGQPSLAAAAVDFWAEAVGRTQSWSVFSWWLATLIWEAFCVNFSKMAAGAWKRGLFELFLQVFSTDAEVWYHEL